MRQEEKSRALDNSYQDSHWEHERKFQIPKNSVKFFTGGNALTNFQMGCKARQGLGPGESAASEAQAEREACALQRSQEVTEAMGKAQSRSRARSCLRLPLEISLRPTGPREELRWEQDEGAQRSQETAQLPGGSGEGHRRFNRGIVRKRKGRGIQRMTKTVLEDRVCAGPAI